MNTFVILVYVINILINFINKNMLLIEPIYFAFTLNHGYATKKWNISHKIYKNIHCK